MARKDAEKVMLKYIEKILPGTDNVKLYKDKFKKMSNGEFAEFIQNLKNRKEHLVIIAPNYAEKELSVERNFKIAKELGYDFFQELDVGQIEDMPPYRTPIKYLVFDLPFRRTAQLLVKKISIPEDSRSVDLMTNQPTGKSAGGKLTYPEIQIMAAMGMDKTVIELLKFRGGDKGGNKALNVMLTKYGTANQEILNKFSTGVQSTKTLKTYLTAMHLKNNL
jgi:hypothetical protein